MTRVGVVLGSLALVVSACQSSAPSRPEAGEVNVPKMPEAGTNGTSGGATAAADPAAVVKAHGASHGWHPIPEQTMPKYVPSAELVPELQAAAKDGMLTLATVDEHIEECSGAGGSHILFKGKVAGTEGLIHWGGHGNHLSPGPKQGGFVVVSYEKLAKPESIEHSAFCVPARTIHARAKVVLEVAQASDGERIIADLSR